MMEKVKDTEISLLKSALRQSIAKIKHLRDCAELRDMSIEMLNLDIELKNRQVKELESENVTWRQRNSN